MKTQLKKYQVRDNVLSGKFLLGISSRETVRQENAFPETVRIRSEVRSQITIWKTSSNLCLKIPISNPNTVNIVLSLKIWPKENYETDVGNDNEPILNYINKFKNHPSIKVIKSRKKEEQTFTFNYVSYEEVLNEVRKLQTTKTTQQNDIPTKILKENSEVFARYFHKNINFWIENPIFPSDLKVADVTPAKDLMHNTASKHDRKMERKCG